MISDSARPILLTGRNGQVGHQLAELLSSNPRLVALGREELDLEDESQIRKVLKQLQPALILNAAAYTAVDQAETDQETAFAINARAPGILSELAGETGAGLIHYSTDYVFDGQKSGAYFEDDLPHPMSAYGKSKLEGDRAIVKAGIPFLIFRTSWVYGSRGKNFFLTIQRLAREREELKIVNDQKGAPTSCQTIAGATLEALKFILGPDLDGEVKGLEKFSGIYNLTCSGSTTWLEFARTIIAGMNLTTPPRLIPSSTEDYGAPAPRPKNSCLDCSKLSRTFGIKLPSWESALDQCRNAAGNLDAHKPSP